ncbi:hypothetical protein FQR65_LT16289 [Abscondita terminalis]|nr:hypothetical protein FQR65_LT16289 [Abscondita terminalis]
MMLNARLANHTKIKAPSMLLIAAMRPYKFSGMLNRGALFQSKSERDFIKADTKNARSFQQIYHWLNPDVFIDNHVSNGADYQYTFTYISTHKERLGKPLGAVIICHSDGQCPGLNELGDQKVQVGLNAWGNGGFGIKGSYDYGIADAISLGAGVGIYSEGNTGGGNKKTALSVYARANYHLKEVFGTPDTFDIYPGITMGVLGNTFDFGAHIGFRYFFTPDIGAFAEVGNRGGIGVVFNLK